MIRRQRAFMTDILSFGWAATLASAAGYALSWSLARRGRHGAALALLAGCGLLLRLLAGGDAYLHPWDERYHALVAKNLLRDPLRPVLYADPVLPYDYRDWSANHVWVHKPPLALWLMALGLRLFGTSELAARLPSLLLSTAAVLVIHRLGRLLYGRGVAWFAAFLLSIQQLCIAVASGRAATDHVDATFMAAVLAAVWCAAEYAAGGRRAWNVLAGLALGLAVLSKWLPALVVLPVWLALAAGSRRHSRAELAAQGAVVVGVSVAVWAPWQAWIFSRFPREAAQEAAFNVRHIFEGLDGHGRPLLWHFQKMPEIYGWLVFLPLGWFLWKSARRRLDGTRAALLAWFLLPYVFFSLARTKMHAYTILSAPAVLLVTALFMEFLRRRMRSFRAPWLAATALAGLVLLPAVSTVGMLKPGRAWAPAPGWVEWIKALRAEAAGGRLVVFKDPWPIETMFYLDCVAYKTVPDAAQVASLKARGYRVLLFP
jgi:4-amino-4-deoxy-L-arabinose transferase